MKKVIVAAILFALPFYALFARDVELTVEDADLGIPLEEATVRLWDGREVTCDMEGHIRFPAPDDRTVTIQIAYPGYETRRVTIAPSQNRITVGLRLGGIMESRELVIEAQRPQTSETKSGRSVAISEENLTRTAEIGVVEDVMTSIKLLPGVGYAGMFNALPSIRGGDPGDLTAVLDGFYIERPYHWGGGFSIFDPKMVESARLSHGVFSTRYGHTVSGLLEINSRKPSPSETELDIGISTSATSINMSFPFRGNGGIMAMGKATYWDPFVWVAKNIMRLAGNEERERQISAVRTAPYIRSGAVSGNYRFTTNLELIFNGFIGTDGIGVLFKNDRREERLETSTDIDFDYINYLGFFITGLTFNPIPNMVLKLSLGTGFIQSDIFGNIANSGRVWYSQDFLSKYDIMDGIIDQMIFGQDYYDIPDDINHIEVSNNTFNLQGRFDLDWDMGKGFLFAAGAQELFSQWTHHDHEVIYVDDSLLNLYTKGYIGTYPFNRTSDVKNWGFTSSLYTLVEYTSPNQRIGAEAGLRVDHFYFIGKDFSIQTMPEFNPRINLDFNILKNKGILDLLALTLGTGLFSSMNTAVQLIESSYGLNDFDLKQNRSWTSVAGIRLDFMEGIVFNIEGYYKHIFNRAYATIRLSSTAGFVPVIGFDGEGRVWGFDLMLQKLESRYWDGWISYSFNNALYRNPGEFSGAMGITGSYSTNAGDWYVPSFHRFHNLNIVLNFRPVKALNIAARLGFASGALISKPGEVFSYPVMREDENGVPYGQVMEQWGRFSEGQRRTTPSVPLDVKFSIYGYNSKGKVQSEFYIAVENALALLYTSQGNTSFNSYTGKEDEGSNSANYELPIPMVSLGFKWSY